MLEKRQCILEVLEAILEVIPASHSHYHRQGPATFGHQQRVFAKLAKLSADSFSQLRLWDHLGRHHATVRQNVQIVQPLRRASDLRRQSFPAWAVTQGRRSPHPTDSVPPRRGS